MAKVQVYENADGFLTKDKKQYQMREKILKRRSKKGILEINSDYFELRYWTKTKEERAYQDAKNALIEQDRKNRCKDCGGSGDHDEHTCFGTGKVGCSTCNGTGLTRAYREKTGRTSYMQATWYRA